MRSELMKLIKSGKFPNEKNRVWTMCQVALHMATLAADEAERLKLTDEQFYINFEDALNILSVRDHSGNPEQVKEFKETIESFEADPELAFFLFPPLFVGIQKIFKCYERESPKIKNFICYACESPQHLSVPPTLLSKNKNNIINSKN